MVATAAIKRAHAFHRMKFGMIVFLSVPAGGNAPSRRAAVAGGPRFAGTATQPMIV
jgi:hypothetical protein